MAGCSPPIDSPAAATLPRQSRWAPRGAAGGCVDNPFLWCDNLSNNDPNVLTFMSRGFGVMVVDMAFDTKVMSASNNAVFSGKLPITSEVDHHTFVS